MPTNIAIELCDVVANIERTLGNARLLANDIGDDYFCFTPNIDLNAEEKAKIRLLYGYGRYARYMDMLTNQLYELEQTVINAAALAEKQLAALRAEQKEAKENG